VMTVVKPSCCHRECSEEFPGVERNCRSLVALAPRDDNNKELMLEAAPLKA